jgi:soluble lytic murein transglycosylase-like protein
MKPLVLCLSVLASCCVLTAGTAPSDDTAALQLPFASRDALAPELQPAPPEAFAAPVPPPLPAPPQIALALPPLSSVPRQLAAREIIDTPALIREASRKHRVPAAFIKSIVAAESNFNALAISAKGAIGLMQLMPATAQLFGADPAIPAQNVDAGTHYLRVLMDRYHRYRDSLRRVIAAYNAGPGAVDHYRGVPPYPETQIYVTRVLSFFRQFSRQPV